MKIRYNSDASKLEITHRTHNGADQVLASVAAPKPSAEEMKDLRAKLVATTVPRGTVDARDFRREIALGWPSVGNFDKTDDGLIVYECYACTADMCTWYGKGASEVAALYAAWQEREKA